ISRIVSSSGNSETTQGTSPASSRNSLGSAANAAAAISSKSSRDGALRSAQGLIVMLLCPSDPQKARLPKRGLLPLADVDEVAGDGGSGGHLRGDEVGAALEALAALEIAVRGGSA